VGYSRVGACRAPFEYSARTGLAADSENAALDDGDRTSEVFDVMVVDELFHNGRDGLGGPVVRAKDDDALMGSGRVAADVAEAPVQREDHPPIGASGLENVRVFSSGEAFVNDRVDIMATFNQPPRERDGQVSRRA
jgi:hypothetical protein